MLSVLIRSLIIYFMLTGVMRLLGKRQIGELELSELVTTLLLSEIAAMPVENLELPLSYALIPLTLLLSLEVILSVIMSKSSALKTLFSGRPSILINRGLIDQKELSKNRISVDELISELRNSNITDIADVQYAILEQNGRLTAIPKAYAKQPTLSDLNVESQECGIAHSIVIDGKINQFNLDLIGKTREWVFDILRQHKCDIKNVFLLTADDGRDSGGDCKINLIEKYKKKK